MKLLIKNGILIDPSQNQETMADILIENKIITRIGEALHEPDAEVFDATGLIVAPGLIDMHVHLREPGQEAKEDIASGSEAAAAGGFTTIACMPNTKPVIDNAILVAGVLHRAAAEAAVKVKVIGALSKGQEGKELAEIGDMLQAGAVAVSDDGHYVSDTRLLRSALEYTGIYDKTIISHAEDEALVSDGFMHEGAVSAMLGVKGRPAVAEDIAVMRDILLAEYTGARLHIAHVSSKGAVEAIRQAKRRGVKVTAETTPHHVALTDETVIGYSTATKVNPPLRSADHVQALIEGLRDGTIDAIATDHAPHAFEEKDVEFKYAPSGFAGLETAVGVVLTELYHTGKLSLPAIIRAMSCTPARILDVDAGTLQAGRPADITIIDPQLEWTVDSSRLYTRGKCTPFDKRMLKGRAVATIVDGRIVMKNGKVIT